MKWHLLPAALLMWLVLPGAHDVDRDLPRPYRRLEVPAADTRTRLTRSARACRCFSSTARSVTASGATDMACARKDYVRPPRDFTDPAWRRSTSPRHVFFAIREGIAGTPMPAWKSLSEQDAWNLTAYVLSLESRQ